MHELQAPGDEGDQGLQGDAHGTQPECTESAGTGPLAGAADGALPAGHRDLSLNEPPIKYLHRHAGENQHPVDNMFLLGAHLHHILCYQ